MKEIKLRYWDIDHQEYVYFQVLIGEDYYEAFLKNIEEVFEVVE